MAETQFGPDFGLFRPKKFFMGFSLTRYFKLLQAITVCNFKKN